MSTRPCTECRHLDPENRDGEEVYCRAQDGYVVATSTADCKDWSSKDEGHAEAIKTILSTLRNPLSLMSIPFREEAYRLAEDHGITAKELLDLAHGKARNT